MMTDQSNGPLQQLPEETTFSRDQARVDNAQPVAAAPTLTFSRGPRPLSTYRPANGNPHNRRRSA